MQSTYSRQKYTSLIISLLLHVFLLLLFLLLKLQERSPLTETLERRQTPARVTYNRVQMPSAQPVPQMVPPQAMQTMPETSQQEATVTPSAQDSTLTSAGAQESSFAPEDSSYMPPGDGAPRRPKGKRSMISGSTFMNAFRQSVSTARAEAQENEGSYSHVQQRLEDWAESHYLNRINQAIQKATRFTTKYIHLNEDIEKVIILEIPIEKNGTLGKMADNITGIPDADELIKGYSNQPICPLYQQDLTKIALFFEPNLGSL